MEVCRGSVCFCQTMTRGRGCVGLSFVFFDVLWGGRRTFQASNLLGVGAGGFGSVALCMICVDCEQKHGGLRFLCGCGCGRCCSLSRYLPSSCSLEHVAKIKLLKFWEVRSVNLELKKMLQ